MAGVQDEQLERILVSGGALVASFALHVCAVVTALLASVILKLLPKPLPPPIPTPPTYFEVVRIEPAARVVVVVPPVLPPPPPAAPPSSQSPARRLAAKAAGQKLAEQKLADEAARLMLDEATQRGVLAILGSGTAGTDLDTALSKGGDGGADLSGAVVGGGVSLGGTGHGGGATGRGGGPDVTAEISRKLDAVAAGCYPRAATRLRVQGTVRVRFCIDAARKPTHINLVHSSGSLLLDDAAIDCVVPRAAPLPLTTDCLTVPIRFRMGADE